MTSTTNPTPVTPEPGYYRLVRDVKNPCADKRRWDDATAVQVFPKGTLLRFEARSPGIHRQARFVFAHEDHFVGNSISEGDPEYSPKAVAAFAALAGAIEPAEEDHRAWRIRLQIGLVEGGVLERLIEAGKTTREEITAIHTSIMDSDDELE